MACAGGGVSRLDVRRGGDGYLPARGAARAAEHDARLGLGPGPVRRSMDGAHHRLVSGGRGGRRTGVRLAGRPPGAGPGHDPEHPDLLDIHRPLLLRAGTVAVGGLAFHCRLRHGRGVVAGRRAGDGSLAVRQTGAAGRHHRHRVQRRLSPHRAGGSLLSGHPGVVALDHDCRRGARAVGAGHSVAGARIRALESRRARTAQRARSGKSCPPGCWPRRCWALLWRRWR